MIIGDCFEGDRLEIAEAQHDLYFGSKVDPGSLFPPGNTTLMHLWSLARIHAENAALLGVDPWLAANYRRLKRIDRFNHKTLQIPHEHMAAHFRWLMRHSGPLPFRNRNADYLRRYWIAAWRDYFCWEAPDLLEEPGVLVALCKTVLYRQFDASDRPAAELDRLLIKRYGISCVTKTWRTDPKMCQLMGVAA
jgi:hypothetical protein